MMINMVIVCLGFWAPWIEAWGIGKRISLFEALALELSRLGLFRFTVAAPVVIVAAALIAAIAAILRVWGAAWLGPTTVQHGQMQAGVVMADGPYRYVRNPLYLGVWFIVAALAFIMPPSGALFTMVMLTVFLLRLILGEEAFLTAEIGEPYLNYMRAVPRLIPRLRSNLPPTGRKPHWLLAILSEITPIGIFVTLAFFSWSYNNWLIVRAILVSFGVSLVVRAFVPKIKQEPPTAESSLPV
jgi:protein-S-isoprenylcysteine O-methyltransferase Ste14